MGRHHGHVMRAHEVESGDRWVGVGTIIAIVPHADGTLTLLTDRPGKSGKITLPPEADVYCIRPEPAPPPQVIEPLPQQLWVTFVWEPGDRIQDLRFHAPHLRDQLEVQLGGYVGDVRLSDLHVS